MEEEHVTCTVDSLSSKSELDQCYICSVVFKTKSNLKAHLIKTHKIVESVNDEAFLRKKKSTIRRIYHCPVNNCRYNISKNKGVNKFSVLKQHYQWVHIPHKFICPACNKTFGTAPALKYHEKTCGQRFTCSVCSTDFAEEKFLTYHNNRVHNRKMFPSSSEEQLKSQDTLNTAEETHQFTKVLQPIYIPIIFPMNINDTAMLNSLQESAKSSIDLLHKLGLLRPETKDQAIQVDYNSHPYVNNIHHMCAPLLKQQNTTMAMPALLNNNNNNNNNNNCVQYNWADLGQGGGGGGAYFEDNSRLFMGHCNASMQTMSDNFDNYYNVETQTNLAGFVGRDFECSYGNMLNEDLITSFINDAGSGIIMQNNSEDLSKLSDSHTQTAKFSTMDYVDLSDIETQTNLQELDDLLFKN